MKNNPIEKFKFSFIRTSGNSIILNLFRSIISRLILEHDVGSLSFWWLTATLEYGVQLHPASWPELHRTRSTMISSLHFPLTLTGTIGKTLYSWMLPVTEMLLFIAMWPFCVCITLKLGLMLVPGSQFFSCLLQNLVNNVSWRDPYCGLWCTAQNYRLVDWHNHKQNAYS